MRELRTAQLSDPSGTGHVRQLTDLADGHDLTPPDPDFVSQMEVVRKIIRRRRKALHELAK